MSEIQIFTTALLVISMLTSLVTEGIKKLMTEHNISYKANTLAGIVSVVLAPAACVFYAINNGIVFDAKFISCAAVLTLMSWLCSMVGYDKVIQTFAQFKVENDETN